MVVVVLELYLASASRLVDGLLHTVRYGVGIHYNLAVDVSGSASGCLRQRSVAAEESLLVGIEYGNERNLRQVESFAQQVYTHKHVVHTGTQVVHYLHAVERGYVAVYVVGTDVVVEKVFCKLLCHALGKGGYQHTLIVVASLQNLLQQVVYLVLARPYFYYRVEQSGGSYNLLNDNASRLLQLEVGRCGRHIYHLVGHIHKLVELQRAVVEGCGQAESVLYEVLLAGAVATVHGAYLRHADVTLVDKHKIILREEVEQAVRSLSWLASVKVARVVFYTRAVTHLLNHLHVVFYSLLDALCPDVVAKALEEVNLFYKVVLYKAYCYLCLLLGGNKQVGRVYLIFLKVGNALVGLAVEFFNGVDLVVPPSYAQ